MGNFDACCLRFKVKVTALSAYGKNSMYPANQKRGQGLIKININKLEIFKLGTKGTSLCGPRCTTTKFFNQEDKIMR